MPPPLSHYCLQGKAWLRKRWESWQILWRWPPWMQRWWSESETCRREEGRTSGMAIVNFAWIRACVKSRTARWPRSAKMEAKKRMEIACWMHFRSWKVVCQYVFTSHCIIIVAFLPAHLPADWLNLAGLWLRVLDSWFDDAANWDKLKGLTYMHPYPQHIVATYGNSQTCHVWYHVYPPSGCACSLYHL